MHVASGLRMDGQLAQISLSGSTDARSATALRRVLRVSAEEGASRVIVDLHELDDLDTDVARVLLEFTELLDRAGGWLWLVHGADPAGSELRRSGLHDRLISSPSREAAGWVDDAAVPPEPGAAPHIPRQGRGR